MAKRKRQVKAKAKKPAKKSIDKLPDRRALEKSWGAVLPRDDSPLGQAQQIMVQAFDEEDAEHRIQLAKKALDVCPDCADAYVLLAEHAASRQEALELYRQGVAAGERTIGAKKFAELTGHFWGVLETRPYMRAREGLVHALWTNGQRDEAIGHLQDMLRLNPNDNQGVRYTLSALLLITDRDEEVSRLFEQYDDAMAAWAYSRALLAFRQGGDSPQARQALQAALKINPHVPAYLTGVKFPPQQRPPYYSLGDENEALFYIELGLAAWKSTDGAIPWLKSALQPAKAAALRVSASVLAQLKKLPQAADVWQIDVRALPPVRIDGEPTRTWLVIAASEDQGVIVGHQIVMEAPTAAALWEQLVQFLKTPQVGPARRPTEVRVRSQDWEPLRPQLNELNIQLTIASELDLISTIYQELDDNVLEVPPPLPGLLDVSGMTNAWAAAFYDAAAYFYKEAPWRKIGYEAAIKVECSKFENGPWYAVVMGQSGLCFGLTFYDDINVLKEMFAGNLSDEENAAITEATTVLFVDAEELPEKDLEAARREGWKVARTDAYPNLFRKNRGMSFSAPEPWQTELMEGCLRAVPDFVKQRSQSDAAPLETKATTACGELTLVLSWVG